MTCFNLTPSTSAEQWMRCTISILFLRNHATVGSPLRQDLFCICLPCLILLLLLFDGLIVIKSTRNIHHHLDMLGGWSSPISFLSYLNLFRSLSVPIAGPGCALCTRDRHETSLLICRLFISSSTTNAPQSRTVTSNHCLICSRCFKLYNIVYSLFRPTMEALRELLGIIAVKNIIALLGNTDGILAGWNDPLEERSDARWRCCRSVTLMSQRNYVAPGRVLKRGVFRN
jgi:hypothetical protein